MTAYCEECKGKLISSNLGGDIVCSDCGLVHSKQYYEREMKIAENNFAKRFANNGKRTRFNITEASKRHKHLFKRLEKLDYIKRDANFNINKLRKRFVNICRILDLPSHIQKRAYSLFNSYGEKISERIYYHSGIICFICIRQAVRENKYILDDNQILELLYEDGFRINKTIAKKIMSSFEKKEKFTVFDYYLYFENKLLHSLPKLVIIPIETVSNFISKCKRLQHLKPSNLAAACLYFTYMFEGITQQTIADITAIKQQKISQVVCELRRLL